MAEYTAITPDGKYLLHYGVKGMKWGKNKRKGDYKRNDNNKPQQTYVESIFGITKDKDIPLKKKYPEFKEGLFKGQEFVKEEGYYRRLPTRPIDSKYEDSKNKEKPKKVKNTGKKKKKQANTNLRSR